MMIDLHSHILYDLDDGALTLAESLAMARMAAADGTRVLVATPHGPGSSACRHYDPALIRARVGEVNAALADEQIALEIVAGTEICYDSDVVERLKRGELLTYRHSRSILWSFRAIPCRRCWRTHYSTSRWPATGWCWPIPSGSSKFSRMPIGC